MITFLPFLDGNSRSFKQQISCIPSPLPIEHKCESIDGAWHEIFAFKSGSSTYVAWVCMSIAMINSHNTLPHKAMQIAELWKRHEGTLLHVVNLFPKCCKALHYKHTHQRKSHIQ